MKLPYLSLCCNAPVMVSSSREGTCYFVCTKCNGPTDAYPEAGTTPPGVKALTTALATVEGQLNLLEKHFLLILDQRCEAQKMVRQLHTALTQSYRYADDFNGIELKALNDAEALLKSQGVWEETTP